MFKRGMRQQQIVADLVPPQMTICSYCLEHMAPRTAKQLASRKGDMAAHPQVKFGPCPVCGGTEWATTEAMITEPQSWVAGYFERLFG